MFRQRAARRSACRLLSSMLSLFLPLLVSFLISECAYAAESWQGDPFQGDWRGTLTLDGKSQSIAAQVMALGSERFRVQIIEEFDKPYNPLIVMEGELKGDEIHVEGQGWQARIACFALEGRKGEKDSFSCYKVDRISSTMGLPAPQGAVVLLDGSSLDQWNGDFGPPPWKLLEGQGMEIAPQTGSLHSKPTFLGLQMHLEFRAAYAPGKGHQDYGNSGLYLGVAHEIQIHSNYGSKGTIDECGAIYGVSPPDLNMCAPPLAWQTYDVWFKPCRYNDQGEIVEKARITVFHNGVCVHSDREIHSYIPGVLDAKGEAPITLQDHMNLVQFRNIWVLRRDGMEWRKDFQPLDANGAPLLGMLETKTPVPEEIARRCREKSPCDISVVDAESGQKLCCNLQIRNDKEIIFRPDGFPFYYDHFSCEGQVSLTLSPGKYQYEAFISPEYAAAKGFFVVEPSAPISLKIPMKRLADMAEEGWWSGDLYVQRPPEQMPLLMKAANLHIAPVITWRNKTNPWMTTPLPENPLTQFDNNRYYQIMAGKDERDGGAFLYLNRTKPFDITSGERYYPPSLQFMKDAKADDPGTWIDIDKPYWWEMPIAIANGYGDSIGIALSHMQRRELLDNEAMGFLRVRERFPSPMGSAYWAFHIYHKVLNAGFRIPPSAGSGSGITPNPLGYNRVYVHLDGEMSWKGWWDAFRKGSCFVTNGPLLRVQADGHYPGHIFTLEAGKPLEIELNGLLASDAPCPSIEVIQDGSVTQTLDMSKFSDGRFKAALKIHKPGWFLLRAVADVKETFRFASTAPFYIQRPDGKLYRDADGVRFFIDWLGRRLRLIGIHMAGDPNRESALQNIQQARDLWTKMLDEAEEPATGGK